MNTKMRFETMKKALPYAVELMETTALQNAKADMLSKEKRASEIMTSLLPVLLVEKQETVFGLLGALSGRTPEEIAFQEWDETKAVLSDLSILDDIADFFIFSVRMARNA